MTHALLQFDSSKIAQKSNDEVQQIAVRWDVKQGQPHPEHPDDGELYVQDPATGQWHIWAHDLRDTRPRLYRTAPDPETGRQGRVAGRILPDDLVGGAPSSAVPLLLGLAAPLSLLLLMGCSFRGPMWMLPALALGVLLGFISNATSSAGKAWALISGGAAILPVAGLLGSKITGVLGLSGPTFAWAAAILVVIVALLFGGMRAARKSLGVLLGLALTLLGTFLVPDFLKPFILLLPACALPWSWSFSLLRHRAVELSVYGTMCNWEDSSNGLGHVEIRKDQTLRASILYSPPVA